MLSPETHGGLGKGALEARLETLKRDQLDFSDDNTKNSVERAGGPAGLTGLGEIGLFKQLDVYVIPSMAFTPTVFGVKYQFLGKTKSEAQKGNFSASVFVGYGERSESGSGADGDLDYLDGNVDHIRVHTKHQDVGVVAGYRWSEKFLHYANVVYLQENLQGKVTTEGTLTDAKFRFQQDGMIYSTGFIYYFAKAHFKLDYSHFISEWSYTTKHTLNTLNTAIGFNW
jgi:hypothetical protein